MVLSCVSSTISALFGRFACRRCAKSTVLLSTTTNNFIGRSNNVSYHTLRSTSSLSSLSLAPQLCYYDDDTTKRYPASSNFMEIVNKHAPTSVSATTKRSFGSSSDDGVVMVSIDEALATTAKALQMIGWDAADAGVQAEIMVAAELCGNNQGLVKMYQPTMMQPTPNSGKPTVERETSNSAVLNANQAPGMLAAVMGADKAVELLESSNKNKNAISIVTTHNTSTSSGQLAFYVERIARKGYIGLAAANSPEFVSAAKGGKGVFGTNPLAVGVPQAGVEYPFTFDMATSAIALFGVLSAKAKGEPLPPNVAYGKDGNWTQDASEVLDGGAIAAFGGHKGVGLSLCVELLAGALSGSAVLGQVESKKAAKSWGHVIIAINPNLIVDDYPTKAASIIAAVKASGDNVRIPGERSAKTAQERRQAGEMPIPVKIWESIVNTSKNGLPK